MLCLVKKLEREMQTYTLKDKFWNRTYKIDAETADKARLEIPWCREVAAYEIRNQAGEILTQDDLVEGR